MQSNIKLYFRGQPRLEIFPIIGTDETVDAKLASTAIDTNYGKGIDNHGARTGIDVYQKTHGSTTTIHNDETGTLQAARLDKIPCIPVIDAGRPNKTQNGRRFKEPGDDMFTLTGQDRHGVMIIDDKGKKNADLKPQDICPTLRAQSHSNEPKVVSGVYTNVSKDFSRPPLEGISRCLKSNKHDAGILDGIKIRKLTPLECFRLQGFPDEYFYRAKEVNTDSQLYKQAGNSVTVNVIYTIANKLPVNPV